MPKNRNDHRVRVSKMMIRKAFTKLLSQKPIQSISIKELCELAGIHRGTFYAHYQDIYALLEEIENEMLRDFKKALQPILTNQNEQSNPVEICMEIFKCLADNSDMCIIMLGDYSDKAFVSKLIGLGKEKCIKDYSIQFPRTPLRMFETFYTFVSNGCIGLLRNWLDMGMIVPYEEVADAANQIMLYGIGFLEQANS